MFQQLQKLQAQDPAQSAKAALPTLPAKLQSSTNVEGLASRKQGSSGLYANPGRDRSDQELAQNSRPVLPNRSAGLVDSQAVKVEVEAPVSLNPGVTDIFWRDNPISQANQVQLVILLNEVF